MAIIPMECTVSAKGVQNPDTQSNEIADALQKKKAIELIEQFKNARRKKK